jgi:hypothetical protein
LGDVGTAQKGVEALSAPDLASVFREEAERLGLKGLSEDIAKLTTERQAQQRVLEDLPETLRESVAGAGESITTRQLGLQAAERGRPIVRNISDLLSSISVLGGQYERGLGQAQFATGLAGEQFGLERQQALDVLGGAESRLGAAQGLFGSLFPSMVGAQEGALGREFQAGQAKLGREFEASEAKLGRQFQAEQGALDRAASLRRASIGTGTSATASDVNNFAAAVLSGGAQLTNVPSKQRGEVTGLVNSMTDDLRTIQSREGNFLSGASRDKVVEELSEQYPEFTPETIRAIVNRYFPPQYFGFLGADTRPEGF